MSNQIIHGNSTIDNPDGILFVPKQVAIDLRSKFTSGLGSASETVAGSIVSFVTNNGATPLPTQQTIVEIGEFGPGYYYYHNLTNAEKLALNPNTPINSRVYVTDWLAAGLSGPKQILTIPSISYAGISIVGLGVQTGIYTKRGTFNGKNFYNRLGFPNDTSAATGVYVVEWSNNRWNVYDGVGSVFYYSLSVVALPEFATNWLNASDNTPANIIITEVLQGKLDAGLFLEGAGTLDINGSYPKLGISKARLTYTKQNEFTVQLTNFSNGWEIANSNYDTNGIQSAFPFETEWVEAGGTPPAPIVSRNDIASEANWNTLP